MNLASLVDYHIMLLIYYYRDVIIIIIIIIKYICKALDRSATKALKVSR